MAKAKITRNPTITKKPRQKSVTDILNSQQLSEIMDKGAKGFTTTIANAAAKILYQVTKKGVYDSYKPEVYKRTYQMVNSIVGPQFPAKNPGPPTTGKKGKFTAIAGFDTDRIQLQPWRYVSIINSNGVRVKSLYWGSHTDYKSRDRREELIDRFENQTFKRYGVLGSLVPYAGNRTPIYEREPVHMVQTTENIIQSVLDRASAQNNARTFGDITRNIVSGISGAGISGVSNQDYIKDIPF